MTDNEKFIFKTLQWFLALGVTLMLSLQVYVVDFIFDTYSWKSDHELKHQMNDSYYMRRVYIDSTNYIMMKAELMDIKTYLNELNKVYPKLEAILPKEDETYTNPDLQR